jgi:hypothetical protein
MAWINIVPELQNIYLQEFSIFAKWLVFSIMIGLSILYLFYFWKNQKPTNYFSVAVRRIFMFGISIATLLSSPFMLIGMSPEYSFWEFYSLPLLLYSISLSIVIIGFIVDLIRFGIPVLLKFGGLNWNDPKVQEVHNSLKNNKHLIKW